MCVRFFQGKGGVIRENFDQFDVGEKGSGLFWGRKFGMDDNLSCFSYFHAWESICNTEKKF